MPPPLVHHRYQPRYDGVRPAYGFFVRHTVGITIRTSVVSAAAPDARPAFVLDDCQHVMVEGMRVPASAGAAVSACDIAVRGCSGNWSDGGALRTCRWTPKPSTTASVFS